MKIVKDRKFITRIFDIEDESSSYTVTYSETYSGWEWLIEDSNYHMVHEDSDLGLKLIGMCVLVMGINN